MMFNSKDATRCYKESLKLDPGNPQVLNNLGTVYASLQEVRAGGEDVPQGDQARPASRRSPQEPWHQPAGRAQIQQGLGGLSAGPGHRSPDLSATRPTVENPVQRAGPRRNELLHGAGCARAGYTDCALQYLRMALDEGFTTRKKVAADSEFASLRRQSRPSSSCSPSNAENSLRPGGLLRFSVLDRRISSQISSSFCSFRGLIVKSSLTASDGRSRESPLRFASRRSRWRSSKCCCVCWRWLSHPL